MARIATPPAQTGTGERHRLFWRWHLYAGLFVAPFLLMLAVTGAIYLFNDELNDAIYPELRFAASASAAPAVSPGAMLAAAEAAVPGATATRIDVMEDPARTARVHLAIDGAPPQIAYVDPGTGAVQGTLVPARTLTGIAERLHGTLMVGDAGSYLIELAASWSVLLIVTGLYLAWPRGGLRAWAAALVPNLRARGRAFWRGLHGATGLWVALLVLFLIFTGLPWSVFWGQWVRGGAEAIGAGYPAAYRRYVASDAPTLGAGHIDVPWTLQGAPLPAAAPADTAHAGHHGDSTAAPAGRHWTDAGLRAALTHVRGQGVEDDLRIFLPKQAGAPVTAYTYPAQPQGQITWHFDAAGTPLLRVGFEDYGALAKGIELGVQLHMGRYFGRANQLLMLAACIGVVVLCVSGTVMWWRRRPAGRIGAPRTARPAPARALIALLAVTALLLPMLAVSLLCVLVFDRIVRPRIPVLRWLA